MVEAAVLVGAFIYLMLDNILIILVLSNLFRSSQTFDHGFSFILLMFPYFLLLLLVCSVSIILSLGLLLLKYQTLILDKFC